MTESASAYFPDDLSLLFASMSVGRTEATDIETAYSGREVRRSRYPLGGYRNYKITTVPLDQSQAQELRDFMKARRGRLEAFYFFPPDAESYIKEAVGSYTGLVSGGGPYDILVKSGSYTTKYVGADYLIPSTTTSTGTGTGGCDTISFSVTSTPTLADGGTGGSLSAGAYHVLVTAVTSGTERLILTGNAMSVRSASLSPGVSHKIDLSAIPLGLAGTSARKIYRTKAGGSTYYLDSTISDNSTTTLTISQADSALVTPLATTETISVTATGRPQILVRSDMDNYEHGLMLDAGFHTMWQLTFKEVR